MKSLWNTKLIYKILRFYILTYFLHTGKEKSEFGIFQLPFMMVTKSKILGVNLAKYVQNIYKKNYKTLMKEVNEDLDT